MKRKGEEEKLLRTPRKGEKIGEKEEVISKGGEMMMKSE